MNWNKFSKKKFNEITTLARITEKINTGLLLDEVLDSVFESFRPIIPYNRIGVSLIEENINVVRARWARSDAPVMKITEGYSAPLEGSSLQTIIDTNQPRIINDLEDYLLKHPNSESTQLIVEEGMRSSLTCPLIAMNSPVGFMFFSSMRTDTYRNLHIEMFMQIAHQLSTIIEKSRLYQQLVELNQLKNKFLGVAAHDLRNPVGVVMGYLKLFKDGFFGEFPDKQKKIINTMYKNCESSLDLLSDLLDVSAIESGHLSLDLREVDCQEFFEECLTANSVLAQSKSIQLKLELDESLGTVVFDPNRINQVLNNLITNAIKFSHPNTSITMKAELKEDEVYISIIDQGQGIPSDELPRVFEAFGKLSVRPTSGEKSTGLGLAIVKKIIDAHNGRIWVKSEVGKGTTFTFTLPAPTS